MSELRGNPKEREKAAADLASVVAFAESVIAVDENGPNPCDLSEYGLKARCDRCGRHRANKRAWDRLQGGEGTNLCWDDCDSEGLPMLAAKDVVPLARAFLAAAATGEQSTPAAGDDG